MTRQQIQLLYAVLIRAEMAVSYGTRPLRELDECKAIAADLAKVIEPDFARDREEELMALLNILSTYRHNAVTYGDNEPFIDEVVRLSGGSITREEALHHLATYVDSVRRRL
jgi:hypothetical protein